MNAIGHFLGLNSPNKAPYLWWSGSGGIILDRVCNGAIVLLIWHHLACHTDGCKRIARHHVAGQHYRVCRRCYEAITGRRSSLDEIRTAHEEHDG